MWRIVFVTWDIYSDLNLVILIRTIRAYVVVVILNLPSWLSGVLCYHGYKPAHVQQAPLWEGLWRQGCSSREGEGGTWELCHSNLLAMSTFFSKLQTAALIIFSCIMLLLRRREKYSFCLSVFFSSHHWSWAPFRLNDCNKSFLFLKFYLN